MKKKSILILSIFVIKGLFSSHLGNFYALGEDDKVIIQREFGEKLGPKYILSNEEKLKELIDVAKEIAEKFIGQRIFGLGQSPAYIVEAAAAISELKSQTTYFNGIAFSSGWIKTYFFPKGKEVRLYRKAIKKPADEIEFDLKHDLHRFVAYKEQMPTQENSKQYKTYLENIGFSPSTIVNEFKNNGKKTILVEYARRGIGLLSFLSFVYGWAAEQKILKDFLEAFEVVVLRQTYLNKPDFESITDVPYKSVTRYTLQPITPTTIDISRHLMEALGGSDKWDDRLVPKFARDLWTAEGIKFVQNYSYPRNAILALYKIMSAVVKTLTAS